MVIVYEGSFDGLLSAIAYCWQNRIRPEKLQSSHSQISLLEEKLIERRRGIGRMIRRHLAELAGDKVALAVLQICWQAYLAEKAGIDMAIYKYLILAISIKADPSPRFNIPEVNQVVRAARAVEGEAHRFQGLLRFYSLQPDLYLADFQPDYNVLPLILPHFTDRFQDQDFIIRDLKRNLAAAHVRGGRWCIYRLDNSGKNWPDAVFLHDSAAKGSLTASVLAPPTGDDLPDTDFSQLWRRYLQHLSIPQRKNLRLQRQNLPLKYRRYLPEFARPEKKEHPETDAPG